MHRALEHQLAAAPQVTHGDYMKQMTFEAQAFLEAVQFFRQEKGHYGSWDIIMGSEIQVLSNLVMEELLPTLQTDLLPKMKGKKNDRKRAWFGLLEEAYNLVQHQVSEGLSVLKEECRALTKGLEGTIRSDMDQIVNSKNFLTGKIKAMVAQPAERSCGESVQPFLASILEELMGPVSSGFSEVRTLFEKEVDGLSQGFHTAKDSTWLKEHLNQLVNLPLDSVKMEPCYAQVNLLQERLQDLKSRFRFPHVDLVVQRTQNYMQELMENAVFTFEQLLAPHLQGEESRITAAIEKVKLRVLKQYDYDSSTIRKKIFQEALVQITLPTLQKALASTCKPELQKYEQFIFSDHTHMIHVENVYEEILHQILLDETLKVIKEAAILKKHNLFEDNMALPSESVSSLTDLKIPTGTNLASPATTACAFVPGPPDNETPSIEVFQESEEKKQAGLPNSSAEGESLSFSGPSPPSDGDGQVILSSEHDSAVTPAAAENLRGSLAQELELGETPENEEPTHEQPELMAASGSLKELRESMEMPVELAPVTGKDTNEGTLVLQECENEEGKTQLYPEVSQISALQQENCEENSTGEREAGPPAPEAGAPGVDPDAFPAPSVPPCSPAGEGHPECTGHLDPKEEPAGATQPTGRELEAGEDGGEAVWNVEDGTVPQEVGALSCDPVCPKESQVSEELEVIGGNSEVAPVVVSEDTQEGEAVHVYECQWVAEDSPDTGVTVAQESDMTGNEGCQEDSPGPPSEE
ncbi:protein Niban 1 isoform 2-T2 [Thomomys bottae]